MSAKIPILLTSLLLAGSAWLTPVVLGASCTDDSSFKGPYAPVVLTAPENNYYYYFGAPDTGDDGAPILPFELWHEINGRAGLQIHGCVDAQGHHTSVADERAPSLVP